MRPGLAIVDETSAMADSHERADQSLGILLLDRICRVVKIALKQTSRARISSKTTWQIVWARTCVLAQIQDDFQLEVHLSAKLNFTRIMCGSDLSIMKHRICVNGDRFEVCVVECVEKLAHGIGN